MGIDRRSLFSEVVSAARRRFRISALPALSQAMTTDGVDARAATRDRSRGCSRCAF
jgi:hypothetical protein